MRDKYIGQYDTAAHFVADELEKKNHFSRRINQLRVALFADRIYFIFYIAALLS